MAEKFKDVEDFPHFHPDYRAMFLYALFFISLGIATGMWIGHEPDGKVLSKWYELGQQNKNYCDKTFTGKYIKKYETVECFTVIGQTKLTKAGKRL